MVIGVIAVIGVFRAGSWTELAKAKGESAPYPDKSTPPTSPFLRSKRPQPPSKSPSMVKRRASGTSLLAKIWCKSESADKVSPVNAKACAKSNCTPGCSAFKSKERSKASMASWARLAKSKSCPKSA